MQCQPVLLLISLKFQSISPRRIQNMALLWRLLAVGAFIIGSASLPTGTQAVLSSLVEAHELKLPSFGVGFHLTASYGHVTQPLLEELEN